MRKSMFVYHGNKNRLIPKMRSISHLGIKRVVEPFLGSGAYSIAQGLPAVGYEINERLCGVWKWLQNCTAEDLYDLEARYIANFEGGKNLKVRIDDCGYSQPEADYVRLQCGGMVPGSLKNNLTYWNQKGNRHRSLAITGTINCLEAIRNIEVRCEDGHSHVVEDGDLLFVDPPYLGTQASYISSKGDPTKLYDPQKTVDLINSTSNPIIMTYGERAEEVFPDFKWEVLTQTLSPNVFDPSKRRWKNEMITYINFPEPVTLG